MTAFLRRSCAAVGAPLGMVLEGGYSLEALTGSVAALAPVLGGSVPLEEEALEVHPLAERAVDRLARWWPALC
jgi:acetoin utilization deacetylase AcuC-like enzyme